MKVKRTMPRRSARNISKDIKIQEEFVSNDDSKQSPPGVVEVIDEFVAVAENQEGLGNHDETSNDIDIINDQKETTVTFFIDLFSVVIYTYYYIIENGLAPICVITNMSHIIGRYSVPGFKG